jgi:hypothetical protein
MFNICNKKLPPYARQLKVKLGQGHRPKEIWLWMGASAWHKARSFIAYRDNLVLPINTSPADFNWIIVKGFEVLGVDTSGIGCETIRQLAYEILKAGASIFRIILPNFSLAVFSRGDSKDGK